MASKKPTQGVYYVPAAKDAPQDEELQELAQRRSPMRLFMEDIILLLKNLALFPDIILPIKRIDKLPGVEVNPFSLVYGYSIVGILALLELPILVSAIPAFIVLPGWLFSLFIAAACGLVYILARTTWDTFIVESAVDIPSDTIKAFASEKWVFINGIATSHPQLVKTVANLSATFKRPVTGIHNRSYGIIGDLIECLIQRSFSYHTQDVRIAEASLIAALTDDAIQKVVLIAHSQGGIIVSLVLDRVYNVLPAELFKKLEIYTFGSAAAFFHNPLTRHAQRSMPASPTASRMLSRAKSATDPAMGEHELLSPPKIPNRLIPVIEHYVNALDLVPRWGVLYHVLLGTGTTYSGRVFVHEKASGHLFDEHYLAIMFPLGKLQRIRDGDPQMFLNHVVGLLDLEEDGGKKWGIWRASTWTKAPYGTGVKAKEEESVSSTLSETGGRDGGIAHASGREAAVVGLGAVTSVDLGEPSPSAPTVMQLSKLWRYMDGGIG